MKISKSFRIEQNVCNLIKELSNEYNISQADAIENAIKFYVFVKNVIEVSEGDTNVIGSIVKNKIRLDS